MADDLTVNASGLFSGAADSRQVATSLGVDGAEASGRRPSQAGVAAVRNAIATIRGRQAQRVNDHVGAMSSGSDRYDDTDGGAAGNLTVTV